MKFLQLDEESLNLRVYSDFSRTENSDLTSQIGYIVLLCNKNDDCLILHYTSNNLKLVVLSGLYTELVFCSASFDYGTTLPLELENIFNLRLLLNTFTDSKYLFDSENKANYFKEGCLMIAFSYFRNSFEKHQISNVEFTRPENYPSSYTGGIPIITITAFLVYCAS